MPDFLLGMEYNLETTLLASGISFILAAILVWVIMAMTSRSRLTKLRTTLEKEITASEAQRMQLGTDLNQLQQKLQQTELKVTEQAAQITELTQRNLSEAEKAQTELQQAQQSWQARLTEKDQAASALTATVNEQTARIIALEHNLQQQQTLAHHYDAMINAEIEKHAHLSKHEETTIIPEDSTLRRHYLTLLRANIEKNKAPRPTDSTLRRHYDAMLDAELEKHLACHSEKEVIVVAKPLGVLDLQQTGIKLRKSYQALEKNLADSAAVIKELQAKLQAAQRQITTPSNQAAITALNTTLSEQSNYVSRLEYDLEVKKSIISDHDTPLHDMPVAIVAKQEEDHARIVELEGLLDFKDKTGKHSAESLQTHNQQVGSPKSQESYQALQQKLADSEALIKELQTALTTAQTQTNPATVNSDLTKKLASQEAAIVELNAALAEQANYLSRLEYDLEVKKSLLNNQHEPLQEIPAAIVAKQQEAQARIAELERLLNPKQKSAQKISEKTQSTSSELLNPAKQQIEEMSDKTKHFSEQLKGFYNRVLGNKVEEKQVVQPKSSELLDSKKSQPEKTIEPEKTSTQTTTSSSGLTGFFNKLDKSAEEVAPVESPKPVKSHKIEPEKPEIPAEEPVKKGSGLMGFFKKLDNSAEIVAPVESSTPRKSEPEKEEIQPEETAKKTGIMGFFKKTAKKP